MVPTSKQSPSRQVIVPRAQYNVLQHQRDPSGSRTPAPSAADATAYKSSSVPASTTLAHTASGAPSGKPTSSVGLTVSQHVPRIVSIRAGQGPADPHATLPKVIHSGVTPLRQTDPLPPSQHQPAASRPQDGSLQALLSNDNPIAYAEAPSGHHHSSVNRRASGAYQQSGQSYSHTTHSQGLAPNGPSGLHGGQSVVPDVVVRPPSAAPVPLDPYSSRSRSTPVPDVQPTAYAQTHAQPNGDVDAYRSNAAYAKGLSQDLPSRFPVYEDAAASRPSASGAPQHPSASPKRGLTYPGASAPSTNTVHVSSTNYLGTGNIDPRSPKPPSLQTITNDTSRSHAYASGSPAAVPHAVSTSSSTPKHSSSARLHSHRNGSNDTIAQTAPTKPSPSGSSQQHLPRRTSVVSLQPQPHAYSRPDASTTSRQPNVSSGYPDIARYRSPTPQTSRYPNAHDQCRQRKTGGT